MTTAANTERTMEPTAQDYFDAGYSIFPVMADGTKQPAVKWEPMQTTRCSQKQVDGWFGSNRYGIGIVGGCIAPAGR